MCLSPKSTGSPAEGASCGGSQEAATVPASSRTDQPSSDHSQNSNQVTGDLPQHSFKKLEYIHSISVHYTASLGFCN